MSLQQLFAALAIAVAGATISAGCGSGGGGSGGGAGVEDLCTKKCDCEGCNNAARNDCNAQSSGFAACADKLGCTTFLDDYTSCLEKNAVCMPGPPSRFTAGAACDAEASKLDNCAKSCGSTIGAEPCSTLAAACAACTGAAGKTIGQATCNAIVQSGNQDTCKAANNAESFKSDGSNCK